MKLGIGNCRKTFLQQEWKIELGSRYHKARNKGLKKAWLIKTPQAVLKEVRWAFLFSPSQLFFNKLTERKLFGRTTKWICPIFQDDTLLGSHAMPTGSMPTMVLGVGSTIQEGSVEVGIGLARGLMQPYPGSCSQAMCAAHTHWVAPSHSAMWHKNCASHTSLPHPILCLSIQVRWVVSENHRKGKLKGLP